MHIEFLSIYEDWFEKAILNSVRMHQVSNHPQILGKNSIDITATEFFARTNLGDNFTPIKNRLKRR